MITESDRVTNRKRQPIRVAIIDQNGKRHGPFGDAATMEHYIERHFSPLPIVFDGEGYDLEFVGGDR